MFFEQLVSYELKLKLEKSSDSDSDEDHLSWYKLKNKLPNYSNNQHKFKSVTEIAGKKTMKSKTYTADGNMGSAWLQQPEFKEFMITIFECQRNCWKTKMFGCAAAASISRTKTY